MKYSKTAITQLNRWYKQVLIKCAIFNSAVLVGGLVAAPAMATPGDINAAVQDGSDSYVLNTTETLNQNGVSLGSLGGGYGLTINGGENVNKINAYESNDTGITVGAYGGAHNQTLTINNAKLSGFATALQTVSHTYGSEPPYSTAYGHLNLNNVTFLNNSVAISNTVAGTSATLADVTMGEGANAIANDGTLSLSGTNTINAVSGAGTMAITAGTTTVNGSLAQTSGVTNGGTLNISAGNLNSGITNNNILNLSGGTLDANKTIDNNGTLNILGVVTNTNHTIDNAGGTININGTVGETETLRSLTTAANAISGGTIANVNANGLILTGGALGADVEGAGSTKINGDVTATGATSIAQAINIASGSLTALAGNIGGTVTNNVSGGLVITDGILSQNVTTGVEEGDPKVGTTIFSGVTTGLAAEKTIDQKTVTNTATAYNAGVTDGQAASFTNNGTITADVNNYAAAGFAGTSEPYAAAKDNSATFTNAGIITGAVANNAAEYSTASFTNNGSITGDVANVNVANGKDASFANSANATITGNFTNTGVATGAASASNAGIITGNLTNNAYASFTNTGDGVVQGSVTNAANATLTTLANKIATADNATITNDGTLTLEGGALTKAIANAAGNTETGVVELQADTSIASTLSVKQKDVSVTGASVTNAGTITTVTLDNTGSFTNSGTVNATTLTNNKTVDNSGNITAAVANTATTADVSFTNSGTITGAVTNTAANGYEADFINNKTIAGDFTNTGFSDTYKATVTNNGTITGSVNNANTFAEFTTAADMIATLSGGITNNGTLNLTGGTLSKNIAGSGTTHITGAVTLEGDISSANEIDLAANSSLDLGSNTLTLAADKSVTSLATGIIKMNLDTVDGAGNYEGGHINVDGAGAVSGGKLDITVADSVLTEQGSSATLTLFSDYTLANISLNGLYALEKTGAYTYKLTNSANDADTSAADAGSANNQQTADAWNADNGFARDTAAGTVQKDLNIASHTNVGAYTDALTEVAPTDSAVHSALVQEVNNQISGQIAKRLSGQGLSSGDAFTRRGAWASVLYNHAKQDSSSSSAGFSGDTTGLALGLDGDVNDTTTVGFGYAYSKSDIKSAGRKTDIEGHNIFAYAKYKPAEWYVRGNLGYGMSEYKEKSNILGTPNSAKYDVDNYNISAYAGYDFDNGITPEAGLRYTYIDRDDYTDALGQSVDQKNFDVLTAVIGTKYAKTFANDNYTVTPSAFIAATYDLMSDNTTALVKVGNSSYDVKTQKLKRFGIETGLDAKVNINDWELIAGYELGIRDDFTSHTGMLKAKYNF